MNFEVLVHGVPYGQDYWGPEEDRDYGTSFYGTLKDEIQYVVEPRKVAGNYYCYYTYCRSSNVLDKEGRSGSYFAITYRFDMYYANVAKVFQIMDMVFDKYVMEVLLSQKQKNLMYLCSSFKEKKEEIKKLEKATLDLLSLSIVDKELMQIDNTIVHQGVSAALCNPSDFSADKVLSLLRQNSKVVASPNQVSIKETSAKKAFNEMKAQHAKETESLNQSLEELKDKNKLLSQTVSTLKLQVEEKETELRELGKQAEIHKIVSDIKEPITKLSDYFCSKATEIDGRDHKNHSKKKVRFSPLLLNTILIVLIAILSVIILLRVNGEGLNNTNPSDYVTKKQYEALEKTCMDLQAENAELNSKLAARPSVEITDADLSPIDASVPAIKIDVVSYSGGDMIVGSEYNIRILLDQKNGGIYYGKGKWQVDGFSGFIDDNRTKVRVKPNREGRIMVSYTPENGTAVTREFNAIKKN